ncbi:TetR/AcrR family transcriptional regulator [Halalkalibacter sp. APA_J-10(15)]|uniref:TetR/AcrR family transcriptional regulator n=1 Tax=unclassified Halalkalibacter TaxID=2893063 RepID=UPI001FF3AAB9|nr:TetR/AcrR family transcriptional regulator [Halalkalibacter sp. APA_J-10(15)]MCK0471653.1 TetR/AcrR family transcriptional regulator [Halalkalibacter sp. APA_J-10(15)]
MVSNRKKATSEKIMDAAIELFSKNGFEGVTTEEIAAEAGFSEKTLFRHFKSKQNLLEQAIDRYHYADEMRKVFDRELSWNIEDDLWLISENYHRIMYRNRKMLRVIMKVGKNLPELHQYAHRHPKALQEFLTNYFVEMKKQDKLYDLDEEKVAITFLYMNFGLAQGRMNEDSKFSDKEFKELLKESVTLFTRGVTP